MEAIKQVQKKYTSLALAFSIGVALLFILMGHKPVGKGLILGAIFSVLNFILMGKSIVLNFGRSKAKTFTISMGSIIFRYLLLAIPLIAAVKHLYDSAGHSGRTGFNPYSRHAEKTGINGYFYGRAWQITPTHHSGLRAQHHH